MTGTFTAKLPRHWPTMHWTLLPRGHSTAPVRPPCAFSRQGHALQIFSRSSPCAFRLCFLTAACQGLVAPLYWPSRSSFHHCVYNLHLQCSPPLLVAAPSITYTAWWHDAPALCYVRRRPISLAFSHSKNGRRTDHWAARKWTLS